MKDYSTIISMMSGTSVDSVDACLVKIFSDLKFEIIDNYSLEYPVNIRKKILDLANNTGSVKDVCTMNFVVGEIFAQCANLLVKKTTINRYYKN